MNCFAFDIETIPDTDLGISLYDLDGLSPKDAAKAMEFRQLQKSGSEFLPLFQHRVVAISVAFRSRDGFRVWTLGDPDSPEDEIIRRFFDGIEKYTPDLVSWNGSGFDLPVLHYRALRHGIQAPRYWENGDDDRSFRYNNYMSRYHWRHMDVMDILSGFQPRARAGLDDIATMLGYPGKMGMGGDKVWEYYLDGKINEIRDYCETDVLNTYLVWLRFQHMRGVIDDTSLKAEEELVRETLAASDAEHLGKFLSAWQG